MTMNIKEINLCVSDSVTIAMIVMISIVCEFNSEIETTQRVLFDYKSADWRKFRTYIDHNVNEIRIPSSIHEIDHAINRFTTLIVNARSIAVSQVRTKPKPKMSAATLRLIQHKNSVKRAWQRTHIMPDKQQLKRELNRLQKQINEMVNFDLNQCWERQLRNVNKGDKKLWKSAKQFRGKADSTLNKIKIPGLLSIDDNDRANRLAEIYKRAHTLTSDLTHEIDSTVRNTVSLFKSMYFIECQTPVITSNEISNIIKCMKPFKSPGADSIQNILLKNLPPSAICWLTHTINACLKYSYWPTSFKTAKIIPILKQGKPPSEAQSYRPISLLNAMGKILEKIIYHRLVEYIEENQLLPEFQFGFRKGHSTTHQALRIKKFIECNKRRKWSTGMVLLDIEKAFDSIWHDGLIYKLIKLNLPTFLIRMISAFIRHRKFSVYVNNAKSMDINMPAGLAQGTCISPILYSLFIADMPKLKATELALYADDTATYTSAKNSNVIIKRLAHALQNLEQYFRKWKIKINPNKTQAILFTFDNKRRRIPTHTLKHNNQIINLQNSVNYLGIHFDTKMTFSTHITNAIEKANKCFRALYPLLAPQSRLSTANKKMIFTSVIRPILAYGSPIWSPAAHTHTHKFKVFQNKILKTICKLPFRTPTNFVLNHTQIPRFTDFINSQNNNFLQKCSISNFNLIREIDRI